MRYLLAIGSFLVAVVLFGYFAVCVFQVISDLGPLLAVQEIMDGWQNIAILGGCLVFGAVFLALGVAVSFAPESAR
jgi:hypothetical protein